MKFSLASVVALTTLVPLASAARGLRELAEFVKQLDHNGRRLQLPGAYSLDSFGTSEGSIWGPPSDLLLATDPPVEEEDEEPIDDEEDEEPIDDEEEEEGETSAPTLPTLMEIIASSPDHKTLYAAIEAAYLADPLISYPDDLTIFAPTDEAFAAVANDSAPYFTEPFVLHLIDILLYHVTSPKIMSTDLEETNITMGNYYDANITLDPPMINNANIIDPDIEASNGVVHVIDSVLTPGWLFFDIADVIIEVPEVFSVLADYVAMANLTDALRDEGPFTLFAPMDFAFNQSMDAVNAIMETDDPIAYLTETLLFHVVPYTLVSHMVEDGTQVTMLNGENATFTVVPIYGNETGSMMVDEDVAVEAAEAPEPIDMMYFINGVQIVFGDLYTSNGVIHILGDGVLVPSALA